MKTLSIQRPRPSMEIWIPAGGESSGKRGADEPAALVGIEDFRLQAYTPPS
jgi:hypothetical protein